MKKKLFIINPKQFGYNAGYYYYTKYLRDKYSIDYLCFDKGNSIQRMGNVNIIYFKNDQIKILRTIKFLLFAQRLILKNKYRCIFCVYFPGSFLLGVFFKSISVLDIRSGSIEINRVKNKLENVLIKFTTLFFNRVTILSTNLARFINIATDKYYFLPLGSEIFSTHSKNFEKMHLLYVGILEKRQICVTIDAFNKFVKEYEDLLELKYTIIGYGDNEESAIIDKIKSLKINRYIKFVGRKKYNMLGKYFTEANIGVCYVPMVKYYEYQPPTKLFEYGLSGLYTIGTNTTEIKKYIDHANGITCNDDKTSFYNALVYIYENRTRLDSGKIIKKMKKYHWPQVINNYLLPVLEK